MDVRARPRRQSAQELMLSLWCWRRLLRVPWTARLKKKKKSSRSWRKSTLNTHWKDWCWGWRSLATWCKQPTHWKRPWCWERLKAGEEGDRGWHGWMASLIQWTWTTWAKYRRRWRTGKPGMLPSMGSQRVRHDLAMEQQQKKGVKKKFRVILRLL